jgi:hypothetical protein
VKKRLFITKDLIKTEFLKYFNEHKKAPTLETWPGPFTARGIARQFGGWNKALEFCGLPQQSVSTRIVERFKKCVGCQAEFTVKYRKDKFCSRSCAAKHNNANKVYGYRRSKLEIFVEHKLIENFPELEFHFNRKDTINSELDVYIPEIKLAFELNGIFHYEPIYSKKQLEYIQNNDDRKFQACIERGIELCIIDTSKQKRCNEKTSQQYIDIIFNIIKKRLNEKPISMPE